MRLRDRVIYGTVREWLLESLFFLVNRSALDSIGLVAKNLKFLSDLIIIYKENSDLERERFCSNVRESLLEWLFSLLE